MNRLYWCNVTYQTPSGKYQSIGAARRGLDGATACAVLRREVERFPGLRRIARWTPERDAPTLAIKEKES